MERYWITGVQLGIILSALKTKDKTMIEFAKEEIDRIMDKQFLCKICIEGGICNEGMACDGCRYNPAK
jgi:hypothetical protein